MDDLSKLSQGLSGGGSDAVDATGTQGGVGLANAIQDQGGIDVLIGKLRAAGLGEAVDSWIGTGPNQALAPQQLGAALGDDGVQRLSAGSGLDISALLPLLAAFLPQIVNMLTPDGTVPDGGIGGATGGAMPDLGGLLGGLLGGAGGMAGSSGGAGTGTEGSGSAGSAGLDDLLGGLLGGDKRP